MNSKKILFWVPGGMSLMLHVEAAIAKSLNIRGVKTHAVICDGIYTACMKREITNSIPFRQWKSECASCLKSSKSVLDTFGISYSFIGSHVQHMKLLYLKKLSLEMAKSDVVDLNYLNVNIGRNILSSVHRFLQGQDCLENIQILNEYVYSALVATESAHNVLHKYKPDKCFMSHGIYVDWGPAFNIFTSANIPIFSWCSSYLQGRFYFGPIKKNIDDSGRQSVRNLDDDTWNLHKKTGLTSEQNNILDKYLADRYLCNGNDLRRDYGSIDDLKKHDIIANGESAKSKKTIGVFTHLNWDGVGDANFMLFSTFNEWIYETVKKIFYIDNVVWIIKIHPAEIRFNKGHTVEKILKEKFPILPEHIKIVSPYEKLNPQDIVSKLSGIVTVFGTVGLEAAIMGKPVVLAGMPHYAGKGFTFDCQSKEEYFSILENISELSTLNEVEIDLARKYAYNYFIRRQIPFPPVYDKNSDYWQFQYDRMHLLEPGNDPFVDFICDRIIDGKEFIMDNSLVDIAETWLENPTQAETKKIKQKIRGELESAEKNPSNHISKLINTAQMHYIRGDLNTSLEFLEKAIQLDPCNSEALNDLGVIYYSQHNYVTAGKHFYNAVKYQPLNKNYILNYINMLTLTGDHERLQEVIINYKNCGGGDQDIISYELNFKSDFSAPKQLDTKNKKDASKHDSLCEGFDNYLDEAAKSGMDVNDWIENVLKWQPAYPLLKEIVFPYLTENSCVCEFGPGTGRHARYILNQTPKGSLHLFDHSVWIQEFLKKYFVQHKNVFVHSCKNTQLNMLDNSADLIFSNGTFIELKLGVIYLLSKEFARICKPNGKVVFDYIDISTSEGWDYLERQSSKYSGCYTYYCSDTIDKIFKKSGFMFEKKTQKGKSTYVVYNKVSSKKPETFINYSDNTIPLSPKSEINSKKPDNFIYDFNYFYSGEVNSRICISQESVIRAIDSKSSEEVDHILELLKDDFDRYGIIKTRKVNPDKIKVNVPELTNPIFLEHKRIKFISYPHEWSPGMLKKAALFHLSLSIKLLRKNLYLKDAHPWNILFDKGKLYYVDFTSIVTKKALFNETYLKANKSPVTNEQEQLSCIMMEIYQRMFLPYFFLPLCAYAYANKDLTRSVMSKNIMNATTHGSNISDAVKEYNLSHNELFLAIYNKSYEILNSLHIDWDLNQFHTSFYKLINSLQVEKFQSGYTNYYDLKKENQDHNNTQEWTKKQTIVYECMLREDTDTILDIGTNTGWYAILAAKIGKKVVACDKDLACIESLFKHCMQKNIDILPVLLDFAQLVGAIPSMYDQKIILLDESYRFKSDTVLCLAMIHHLVLGVGMSPEDVIQRLDKFTHKQLLLEFVDINDPLIQKDRYFFKAYDKNPNGFGHYTLQSIIEILNKYNYSVAIYETDQSSRKLLLCKKGFNNIVQELKTIPSSSSNPKPDQLCNNPSPSSLYPNKMKYPDNNKHASHRVINRSVSDVHSSKNPGTQILTTPPSVYIIGLTNICQLKCPLCITGRRKQKKRPQHMPFELFEKIIEKIRPFAKQVQLYKWGESLLHPEIVNMLALCEKYSLNTQISSNLSLINIDHVLEALVKYRLRHLIVSFDGVNQEDYSRYRVGGDFNLVTSNILKIKEYKLRYNSTYPRISLQYLRNKFTDQQVNIIDQNYSQWGADDYYVCDMTTIFKDRDLEAAKQWFDQEEIARRRFLDIDTRMLGNPCYFLYTTMIIEQDGSIPPCCFTTDPKNDYNRWDNKKSILEMYNSPCFIEARKMFDQKVGNFKSTCNDCGVFLSWADNKKNLISNSFEHPRVSVIIPSYNREKMLGLTIESFIHQQYPENLFEIIIADNNSTDNTSEVAKSWQKNPRVPVRYVFEKRQGVHFARNSAAKIANGQILYFTDDDMIADPNLLIELMKVFIQNDAVGTATGRVLPKWEEPPPEWILKHCYNGLLSIFDQLGEELLVQDHDLGVYSCHQAIRKSALFTAGGFNPEYTYGEYIGDGETGLNIKLKDLGYKFGYNGKSVIYHIIPSSRITQDYLNKRMSNQGYADSYTSYKKNKFNVDQLYADISEYLQKLLNYTNKEVIQKKAGNDKWHISKAYTFYYLSRIEYNLRLIHDEKWRSLVLRYNWINV